MDSLDVLIEETNNENLTIDAIDNQHKPDAKIQYPLLQHPHSLLIIAPKGGGKSTFIINCLVKKSFYRKYFDKIYIFSPTMAMDEKFSKMINLPEEQQFTEFDDNTLTNILDVQADTIRNEGKSASDRILFIFDDMAQSNAFNNSKKNSMTKLFFNLRHYNASLWVASQRYLNAMPLNFRTHLSGLILFNIPNQQEVSAIIKENSGSVSRDDFKTIYDYCMDKKFNFMFLNFQVHQSKMFNKNFNPLKLKSV